MKRYFLLVLSILILASCTNPLGKATASSGEVGSLSLSVASASAKSIIPATMTPASYTASGASSTGVTATAQSSSSGYFEFSNLTTGSWTFTIEGLDSSSDVILTGTKAVTISVGAMANASVDLSPASGNGTLSLSLSWTSAAGVSAVSATLTPSSGTANTIDFTVDSTNKMATYSGSLAAGSYELVVTAKNSEGTVVASSPMESVLIYASQTSSATFTISDDQLIAGSAGLIVKIPSEITLALSGNSASLSHGSTMTVTATPSASVDSYAWYLDGTEQSGASSSSFTFGSSLGLGSHTLMAVVKNNGIAFSNSCAFTVIPAVTVSTFAGTGSSGSTDATGTSASFNGPKGITSVGGYLYIADYSNSTIRRVSIANGEVTTFAGKTGTSGNADGTGTGATFFCPYAITNDGVNLYVACLYSVRKIVISSAAVTTIAGGAVSGHADGTGTAATFYGLRGIATDGANLYLADYSNNAIRKIVLSSGEVTTLAGTAGTSGSTDGTGTAARFNCPIGIATDGTNLYVAEYANGDIRKIALSNQAVTTLASSSTGLYYWPWSIEFDGSHLHAAGQYAVFQIDIGTGIASQLKFVSDMMGSGIASVGTTLYVTDSPSYIIRKFTQE